MWIMTQGKKGIINSEICESICVSGNMGKKKSCIISYPSNTILGYYDTEKIAIDELENIFNAINKGENSYQMP